MQHACPSAMLIIQMLLRAVRPPAGNGQATEGRTMLGPRGPHALCFGRVRLRALAHVNTKLAANRMLEAGPVL